MLLFVFWTVSETFRVTTTLAPLGSLNWSLTCARTSFSPQSCDSCQQPEAYKYLAVPTFGSWINAPPCLALGGISPVVAYLRLSMMVCDNLSASTVYSLYFESHTVFPDPLSPTIRVRGVKNWMTSGCALSKERMLRRVSKALLSDHIVERYYPRIESLSILAIQGVSGNDRIV